MDHLEVDLSCTTVLFIHQVGSTCAAVCGEGLAPPWTSKLNELRGIYAYGNCPLSHFMMQQQQALARARDQ